LRFEGKLPSMAHVCEGREKAAIALARLFMARLAGNENKRSKKKLAKIHSNQFKLTGGRRSFSRIPVDAEIRREGPSLY